MIEYENLRTSNLIFFEEFQTRFRETLEGGWFILGNNVRCFEEEFGRYIGNRWCVGVASGLDALTLSLKALDVPEGSEVLVPSNTYIATILSILQCGMKPVLVEPIIASYNIDPARIEEAISKKTKALMIVHLYGKSCDMDPIMKIVKKHDLKLIEDCAQSHGSTYKGKKTGTFGHAAAFSFYPTKNLGALGDGGSLNTDDENVAEAVRTIRNYGSKVKYYNELIGVNSRLDEVQAAFLSVKLRRLDEINSYKRELAKIYLDNLKDDFIKPQKHPDFFDVYHIFNIRHPKRDALKEFLLKNEIKTEIHYPVPPHRQKAMKGILDKGEFPISEEIHRTTLSLPISFGHAKEQIYRVVEVLNKF